MTDRFRLVPAVYVVLRRGSHGNEVLLQRRKNTGYMDRYWAVGAAGHVEAGESVLQAACREAREELDVLIEPHDLVPLTGMHRTGGGTDPLDERVDFFFECRRWQGTPRLTEPTRTAAVEWFPLDALPDPVVPHELFVLETLRAGLPAPITTFGF